MATSGLCCSSVNAAAPRHGRDALLRMAATAGGSLPVREAVVVGDTVDRRLSRAIDRNVCAFTVLAPADDVMAADARSTDPFASAGPTGRMFRDGAESQRAYRRDDDRRRPHASASYRRCSDPVARFKRWRAIDQARSPSSLSMRTPAGTRP